MVLFLMQIPLEFFDVSLALIPRVLMLNVSWVRVLALVIMIMATIVRIRVGI